MAASVALSMGLYISHCFIPPTPGPIAAANTLFEGLGQPVNLLLIMAIGAACSILPLIVSYIFALVIGKSVKSRDEKAAGEGAVVQSYEELVAGYGKLPGTFMSFAPILVPILLMGLSSAFTMAKVSVPFITFLGTPIIALAAGVVLGVIVLSGSGKLKDFYAITDDTLRVTGPILFVTAAGGVLGKVIANTDMVNFISQNSTALSTLGLLFPFLLAAIFINRAIGLMNRIKPYLKTIERVMGGLLVVVGVLLVSGRMADLSYWMLEAFPALGRLG